MFTDGDDNASTITAQAAIRRAKAAGVPVYTIAQGAALFTAAFLKQLSGVSRATGGMPYAIHSPERDPERVRKGLAGPDAQLLLRLSPGAWRQQRTIALSRYRYMDRSDKGSAPVKGTTRNKQGWLHSVNCIAALGGNRPCGTARQLASPWPTDRICGNVPRNSGHDARSMD